MDYVRKITERLTGTRIFYGLPRGVEVFSDIRSSLSHYEVRVIFDVGANVGQSAKTYVSVYPEAQVHCFEPISETFDRLVEKTKNAANIHCHKLALSSTAGAGKMVAKGMSTSNRLLDDDARPTESGKPIEEVDISTIDEFCGSDGVEHISYLKIDTEGNDLAVLSGATEMLAGERIDLIEVEAGMNPANQRHVSLEVLKQFLEGWNYRVFGIYKQVGDFARQGPQSVVKWPYVRRVNAVFISRSMCDQYAREVTQ